MKFKSGDIVIIKVQGWGCCERDLNIPKKLYDKSEVPQELLRWGHFKDRPFCIESYDGSYKCVNEKAFKIYKQLSFDISFDI